jgi:hypothetical protein
MPARIDSPPYHDSGSLEILMGGWAVGSSDVS